MLNWIKKIFWRLKFTSEKANWRPMPPVSEPNTEDILVEPVNTAFIYQEVSSSEEIQPARSGIKEAQAYLKKLHKKIDILANRFARGDLNRIQFERLHDHYREEIEKTKRVIEEKVDPDQWKRQVIEGQSMLIRRLNAARMQGFSIFERRTLRELVCSGKISLDDGAISAFLGEKRALTQEGPTGRPRVSKMKNGSWCCVVPGEKTTTIAQFSEEPAIKQINTLNELQGVFERANRNTLTLQPIPQTLLVVPHNFYINKEF